MTHYFSFLNPGSVSRAEQLHEKLLVMIKNQSILNCMKKIAPYSNISTELQVFPPPLSVSHSHTFGVVPSKLGWKPTYYSPQLSS